MIEKSTSLRRIAGVLMVVDIILDIAVYISFLSSDSIGYYIGTEFVFPTLFCSAMVAVYCLLPERIDYRNLIFCLAAALTPIVNLIYHVIYHEDLYSQTSLDEMSFIANIVFWAALLLIRFFPNRALSLVAGASAGICVLRMILYIPDNMKQLLEPMHSYSLLAKALLSDGYEGFLARIHVINIVSGLLLIGFYVLLWLTEAYPILSRRRETLQNVVPQDIYGALAALKQRYEAGEITEQEYTAAKAEFLNQL